MLINFHGNLDCFWTFRLSRFAWLLSELRNAMLLQGSEKVTLLGGRATVTILMDCMMDPENELANISRDL